MENAEDFAEEVCAQKATWGPGPWQDEPDRLEFEAHGLPCLVIRTIPGHLCGYVAVPPGHPFHGMDYRGLPLRAHGSVNAAKPCDGIVCHVPKPGEPGNVWWFGFDCGHHFDLSPGTAALFPSIPLSAHAVYRDIAYVRRETELLAAQLAAVVSPQSAVPGGRPVYRHGIGGSFEGESNIETLDRMVLIQQPKEES